MRNFYNSKPEGWGVVVETPVLSKAKAAAAAKLMAVENPNRARIDAKLQALKASQSK